MIDFLYFTLCFVLPNTIWQLVNKDEIKGKQNGARHIIWTYVFFAYCAVALYVAGSGTLWDLISHKKVVGGINLIPFSSEGVMTYILNMIMFMPFGFLLPLIWECFRKFWKVLLTGFGFSLLIEITQLFSQRFSDIDDLLMNTLGACIGYLLWFVLCKIFHNTGKKSAEFTPKEPITYVLLGSLGVFLLYNWRILS